MNLCLWLNDTWAFVRQFFWFNEVLYQYSFQVMRRSFFIDIWHIGLQKILGISREVPEIIHFLQYLAILKFQLEFFQGAVVVWNEKCLKSNISRRRNYIKVYQSPYWRSIDDLLKKNIDEGIYSWSHRHGTLKSCRFWYFFRFRKNAIFAF